MTECSKNFEPFCMNFRKFRNRVFEFCRFEKARSIQVSSVVIEFLKRLYPSTRIKVKNRPICREVQVKAPSPPCERHVQYKEFSL